MSDATSRSSFVEKLRFFATTDFCPWANRFVYWLKEPVGWFALATLISVLVGLYIAPIGWTLAASLTAIIAVGMVWPWVAVRSVTCSMRPRVDRIHEGDDCDLMLSVRNHLPLPVWGLAVEGFLDRRHEETEDLVPPSAALAYVRGLCTSVFDFVIRPELRGHYPDGPAQLTCSFPFGIWTAKRPLVDISPITVWPKVHPMNEQATLLGRQKTDRGDGDRVGRSGDFVGVREYQRGDSFKEINWVATARADELIVTQRSGPQCPDLSFLVDVGDEGTIDTIADRIRAAASLLASLHDSGVPLRLRLGTEVILPRPGRTGFAQIMDALSAVPAAGKIGSGFVPPKSDATAITVTSTGAGDPVIGLYDSAVNHRVGPQSRHIELDRGKDLAFQLLEFWSESSDAHLVA